MQGALDSFQFLRADPVLQVMLKIRNALVDGGGALAAFLGRNQAFEPGVFGDNFPRDKAGLLHALQHGGNAGTVGVEPGFQITLVDLLAAFRFKKPSTMPRIPVSSGLTLVLMYASSAQEISRAA